MNKQEIDRFWRDKEAECGSELVTASYARYVDGCPAEKEPCDGLLYIMKNGVYFENFPKDHWLDKMFHRAEAYTRVFIFLEKDRITDVSCFPGQKDKFRLPFGKKLAVLSGLLPRVLLVEYSDTECARVIRFVCAEKPAALCAAYYRTVGAASGTSL